MPLTATAAKRLTDEQVQAIYGLAAREMDADKKDTMIRTLGDDETPLPSGYRATRAINGLDVYEIEMPSNTAANMGRDWPHAILKEGDLAAQVGAVTINQDGGAIAKFSRSEGGQESRRAFEMGGAALSVAYLNGAKGRKPTAFSLRAVSGGKSKKETDMSDIHEIAQLGAKHGKDAMATAAIAAGKSLAEFRSTLLEAIETKPLAQPYLNDTSERQFSIGNVIRAQISGNWDNASFEREVSQELARNYPTQPRGIVVPNMLTRTTMTTSNVANLVDALPRGDLFIDSLQPQSAVMAAGATVLSGLGKGFTIPKATGDLTASFVAEGSAISESNLTIGSLSLSPKRVSSTASFTLEALVQSDPSIDNLVRADLTRQIAQAIDDAALEGDGSGANPTGIASTSGINTLATTGSSTMTHAEALTALSKLEEDNVSSSDAVFICHPTNYATLASTVVDSGSGRFVIDNGTILGRRVIQSTLCTAGTVYLGQYRECMVAMFGGVDLVVDNFSEARSATVLITQHQMVDIGIRHPTAFCKITLTA